MWFFTVSHNQLLLMSQKNDEHRTRVEVYFQRVSSMQLPTVMSDLKVYESTIEPEKPAYGHFTHDKSSVVFKIHARDLENKPIEGFVLALDCQWEEAEKSYSEPSAFIPNVGIPDKDLALLNEKYKK